MKLGRGHLLLTSMLVAGGIFTPTVESSEDMCPMGQYMMGMSSCWMPFGMGLIQAILPKPPPNRFARQIAGDNSNSAPMPRQDPVMQMLGKAFRKSCGKPLQDALTCHKKMDSWCGMRFINTTRFEAAIRSLCDGFEMLPRLGQCVAPNTGGLIGCLSSLTFDGDICNMTMSLRKCLTDLVSACPQPVQNVIHRAFDSVILDKCLIPHNTIETPGKRCAGIASLVTSAMCYTSFMTRMILSAVHGSSGVKDTYSHLCQTGVVQTAIACHAKVQEECSIPYVNTNELWHFAAQTCQHYAKFETLLGCVSAQKAFGMLGCVNNVVLQKEDVLCDTTAQYHVCYNQTFDSCDGDLQSMMESAYQLVTLPCPEKPSNPKCALIEHGATLAMCWYPTIQTFIPWMEINQPGFRYDLGKHLKNLCGINRPKLDATIECHLAADRKCGYPLYNEKVIRRFVNILCNDSTALAEVTVCVDMRRLEAYNTCSMNITHLNPSSDDYFCKMMDHTLGCVGKLFSACNERLQTLMKNIMEISREDACFMIDHTTAVPKITNTRSSRMTTGKISGTTGKISGTTRKISGTTEKISGGNRKRVSIAMMTSLVLAVNANLNGFVNDWMGNLAHVDWLRDEF